MVSILSWKTTIENCEFLVSDETTIVLMIGGHLALFEASAGITLKSCMLPEQPMTTPSTASMRWLFTTDVALLDRLLSAELTPSSLAESGWLVQGYKNENHSLYNYRVHKSELSGPPLITRTHGAFLDIFRQEDLALQLDGSSLSAPGVCTAECDTKQSRLEINISRDITCWGLTMSFEIGTSRNILLLHDFRLFQSHL